MKTPKKKRPKQKQKNRRRKPKPVRTLSGDIWELASDLDYIVIPTNVGWTRSGSNVMGAGLAKQAAQEDPSLAQWYGAKCKKLGKDTPVLARGRLILFPVKPLNIEAPHLSWMQLANIDTIKKSMKQLCRWERPDARGKILIPMVGCGNGKLKPEIVRPVLASYWMNRYRLVLNGI